MNFQIQNYFTLETSVAIPLFLLSLGMWWGGGVEAILVWSRENSSRKSQSEEQELVVFRFLRTQESASSPSLYFY